MGWALVRVVSILFFVFNFTLLSFAGSDSGAVSMEAVVVTAEKEETPTRTGDVDTEQTPAFFSIIERQAFEGKVESLAEVIEKEAGVQVRQSGGFGSFSTVSLRGSTADQVMVFLDGILLNDASGGGVDLSTISLSDVEAIEIYRGISPINFGKTSIGGVVNIRTLRAQEGLSGNSLAGVGSFGTQQYAGYINHKPGRFDYLISGDYLSSDNDFDFVNDNGTEFNSDDDRTESRNNAQVDQLNLLGKFGVDLTDTVRVDLVDQWFSKEQGLPRFDNDPDARATFDTDRNIATLRLTADSLGPLHVNTATSLNYLWKEEEYDDREGDIGLGDQHNRYTTNRVGLDFFSDVMVSRHSLIFSADSYYEKYEPEDLLNHTNPNDSNRTYLSAGLQDSVYFFDETFSVTPALRYTVVEDELRSAIDIFGKPLDGEDRSSDYLTPQIGARYQPVEWLILKANLAEYVREPSFFELFGDRGFVNGNMDLEAEEGVNVDIGGDLFFRNPHPLIPRFSLNAACFYSDVDDLITRVYDARGIGKSVNISGSRIYGVEAGFQLDVSSWVRLSANATWQDTENQSEVKAFDGNKLPGRYETAYSTRLELFYRGVRLFGEYIAENDLYYDTANLLKAEDKEEINAGLAWSIGPVMLSVQGRNLTDEQYEDFNGYPLPGRSYFATVKYSH